MPSALDIVTIDKSWIDSVLRVPALPIADQKLLAEAVGRFPGGMGGNVACTASRLGLRCGMVSWVGDDVDGQQVLADLHRYGVDTTHIVTEPGTSTNYTTVLVTPTGDKAILIVPTAFNTLALDVSLVAYLGSARIVYSAAYDIEQLARVASVVHAAGGLLATDLEPVALDDTTLHDVLGLVDLAIINGAVLPDAEPMATVRRLQAAGPRLVVLTLGAQGAVACADRETVLCPAFKVPAVDTTGAGDCFAAALLTAYLRQRPLDEMLRYAQATAALSIRALGARGALPTDAEVQAFLVARA